MNTIHMGHFLNIPNNLSRTFLALAFAFVGSISMAATPTESLQNTVENLTGIMAKKDLARDAKREEFVTVLAERMDYRAASQRILAQQWRKTSDSDKQKFMDLFSQIIVNTYFTLLEEYDNEVIDYGRERIQRERYAIVDTDVHASGKKIPVRYRLIASGDEWKIYDLVIEGVSLIQNYKDSYAPILRRGGVIELFASLEAELSAASATN